MSWNDNMADSNLTIYMRINNTREDSTHGHHQMTNTEIRLIIFFAVKDREALYSQQKKRPGADCGSDHELLIAQVRLKVKKVGKTTRPSTRPSNPL